MTNQLDEMQTNTLPGGRPVQVLAKQIPVTASLAERLFPTVSYLLGGGLALVGILFLKGAGRILLPLLGLLLIFLVYQKMETCAAYLKGLEQKINAMASEIDNYLEQRLVILTNAADLVEKSIQLDKDLFLDLAKYRSGNFPKENGQELDQTLDQVEKKIQVTLENYPELRSQDILAQAMEQNAYLQREVTAARTAYNDAVAQWNQEIFRFPFPKIVAARDGLTTRIPYILSQERKDQAQGPFFR